MAPSETPLPSSLAHRSGKGGRCVVTGETLPERDLVPVAVLRPALVERLRSERGEVPPDALISRREVDRLRMEHIADLLREERGELTALDREVVESLANHDILSENVEEEIEDARSFGERLSDHLATFGGSWSFLISFAIILAAWLALNVARGDRAFDPYPFILLNLVLSCVAAIQAPIIMMSQRRQEAKDRMRSLNDYRVNLKAELEIRHLHEKIDHILTRQWERLAEMQAVQIELLQELNRRPTRPRG
jgi:uncharacterized membrane protein